MGYPLSRREMLRGATMVGFGLAAPGPRGHAKPVSPNEKLNIALIGIGGRGGKNLSMVSDENIVALCDVDDERAGKAYEKFPKAKKYYDFRRMLEEMESEIDAVVVSTPDHTHVHSAMMAMRMGKHCYCEKPMAHAVAEVRAMTQLAAEKKLATQLGCQRHTLDNMHRVVELVKSGAIGEVRECWARKGGSRGMPEIPTEFPPVPSHLKWDLWLGPAASRPYSPAYAPYNWRFWWDFGTGETGNWGCHILDIPFWALDLKHATSVKVTGPPPDPQRTPKEMLVALEFPARGALPPVKLHWWHSDKVPSIVTENNIDPSKTSVIFAGSKGILTCTFDQRKLYPEKDFADFEAPDPFIPDSPGFHQEWIKACKGGAPATCDFAYSGPLTEAVLLGNTAYRAGQDFEWDAAAMKAAGAPAAGSYLRPEYREGWPL